MINSTGHVPSARVVGSTLGNSAAEQCMARAVRRWRFPSCNCGGISIVRYPIIVRGVGGP